MYYDALFLDGEYPQGTALQHDYNVFALGLVIGLASLLWLTRWPGAATWERRLSAVAVPIVTVAVLLTGSRRGFVFVLLALAMHVLVSGDGADTERRRRTTAVAAAWAILAVVATVVVPVRSSSVAPVVRSVQDVVIISGADRVYDLEDVAGQAEARVPRMEWAWTALHGEYAPHELVFGRGFSYLSEMGAMFSNPTGADYPHNLFLAALLHGGIVLTVLLSAVLACAARRFWTARRDLGPLMPIFMLTAAFALTSSASFYSTELLAFLSTFSAAAAPPGVHRTT
jgi:O-antigen ligase